MTAKKDDWLLGPADELHTFLHLHKEICPGEGPRLQTKASKQQHDPYGRNSNKLDNFFPTINLPLFQGNNDLPFSRKGMKGQRSRKTEDALAPRTDFVN